MEPNNTDIKKKFRELLEKVERTTNTPFSKQIEALFLYFFMEGIKFNAGEKCLA